MHRSYRSGFGAAALLSVVIIACQPAVNQEEFEDLHRAATAVAVAIESGVSFNEYDQKVKALATETVVAKDRAKTEEERELVSAYTSALDAYRDAAAIWKVKIGSADAMWDGEIPVSGRYSADEEGDGFVNEDVKRVAEAYNLETQVHEIETMPGAQWTGVPADSLQRVWQVAAKHSERAAALYRGES